MTTTIDKTLLQWYQGLPSVTRNRFQADVVKSVASEVKAREFERYQFEPVKYIKEKLHWTPWSGKEHGAVGQVEIIEAYTLALRQLHERGAYERGEIAIEALQYWRPGEVIQNWISVDAGHGVGKTKCLAGLVSHFFDCFLPSIVYCFAPLYPQINDLLFKEIRTDRVDRPDLPGRVLKSPEITYRGNHFVKGKATSDDGGMGSERVQGQHGKYLMFILDEAEGIEEYVWNAVRSMASGGIVIVLIARNPRTTTCEAHQVRSQVQVIPLRISCLDHPNVQQNRDVIEGAVRRDYIEEMLEYCEIAEQHNDDHYTFELPWRPGVIYKPRQEFLWRVLGIASEHEANDTFCSTGRYDAAKKREAYDGDDPTKARLGLDAARYGNDHGTLYYRHAGIVQREAQFEKQDSYAYYIRAKQLVLGLIAMGVVDIVLRVDAGGGYSSGVVDAFNHDLEITKREGEFEKLTHFEIIEVNFNGSPNDNKTFGDLVTEMYYHTAEALKTLRLENPPDTLRVDLCERQFTYSKLHGRDVKVLVSKQKFKDKKKRSPDDGDGCALAVAPDYIFRRGFKVWAV